MKRRGFFGVLFGAIVAVVTGGKSFAGSVEKDIRKVQVLHRDMEGVGFWVDTKMKEIRKGNIFMMFESDGEQVVDQKGNRVWVAKGDAYLAFNKQTSCEVWGCEAEPPFFPVIMNPVKRVRFSDLKAEDIFTVKAVAQNE